MIILGFLYFLLSLVFLNYIIIMSTRKIGSSEGLERVSKKMKLQEEKQKRDILVDEVRFLRQRHAYLTDLHAAKAEPKLCPTQNADIHDVLIQKERNCFPSETSMQQESNGGEELVGNTPTLINKTLNMSNNEKKSGKKKVSWKDEVVMILD